MVTDYIFEVSWEICNKVGGIHTVISTKAITLEKEFGDKYLLLGPDVWRESTVHPEFEEDFNLLAGWKAHALSEGLRVRVGRWKIAGRPLVLLIDFTAFFDQKDEIFAKLWEQYHLDSMSGQWDYIEPSLFGYGSARVIESYVKYHLTPNDKVVAQFHEWMTGAGLLYLKQALPQVGTIFTTHATVIGRSIAGNGQPLYGKMNEFNGDTKASEFNVVSKQSMEKICAQNADSFTTVSELTSKECAQFHLKEVDLVTPNGFEDSFVPQENFDEKRAEARESLLKVAGCLLGEELPKDSFIVANSGRYEFKNKGIDIFIDALGKLQRENSLERTILALILIPANHYGARKDLLEKLNNPEVELHGNKYLTHNLHYSDHDPILRQIQKAGLENNTGDKVKIIFVPSYLNGDDGVFNKHYWDLLIGMDLTVFPSYYEPWGYTPLESLAFHIPTVTTSLAGFGLWVRNEYKNPGNGIFVLERDDNNDAEVVSGISDAIFKMQSLNKADIEAAREKAFDISRIALWKNMISFYKFAFKIALEKVTTRVDTFVVSKRIEKLPQINLSQGRSPSWKKVIVTQNVPKELKPLEELSRNLWWSWNQEAIELFESIDIELWIESERNPLSFIENISYEKIAELKKDEKFQKSLLKVYKDFRSYMDSANTDSPQIAYYSMEFGLHESLKIYSGGLGLLAGDYLKEASDYNTNIIGVGLLYRYGYFKQVISASGQQESVAEAISFSKLPALPVQDEHGNWKEISLMLPGRELKARIWRVDVGRVKLFLLDTDFEANMPHDRTITHQLYGGDNENRLKQELLLGIGGIRTIRALGLKPDLYHCNEGHAAFIGLERLREYIHKENLTYPEALEIVRSSTLFTTHTPVPAGHDYFEENMMRAYISHYPQRLKIDWKEFMNLGKMDPEQASSKFSMSCLAVNLSMEVNGVSKLHGTVSKEMFAAMWRGFLTEEVPIGFVTNGVHLPTWVSPRWRKFYQDNLSPDILTQQEDRSIWEKIYTVDKKEIWKIRSEEREELINYVKDHFNFNMRIKNQDPRMLLEIRENLNPNTLTIVFARRFATYKRAHLLFTDLARLDAIVNNPTMPVQFLFSGKAHPKDGAGQDLIKYIIDISHDPRFLGKIVFIENYDIGVAKKLVQGADIWMNTPTRPLEASGTSGEKAVMNGVLHFSVLDGWWAEGYVKDAGWALEEERSYENQAFQDQLDAENIYALLENEIAPAFYERNKQGVPEKWVGFIQNSISKVAPEFTMNRMLRDYIDRFYSKLYKRNQELKKNGYENAIKLASWKNKILENWDKIEVLEIVYPDVELHSVEIGIEYNTEVVLDLHSLSPEEIGVELIVGDQHADGNQRDIVNVQEYELEGMEGTKARYKLLTVPTQSGIFDYGIRVFPKNPECECREYLGIVKWIG